MKHNNGHGAHQRVLADHRSVQKKGTGPLSPVLLFDAFEADALIPLLTAVPPVFVVAGTFCEIGITAHLS